jgi:glycine oxidase
MVRVQRGSGLEAEMVVQRDLAKVEPEVGEGFAGGAYLPREAQVDPPRLIRAVTTALARTRATLRAGTSVARLVIDADRCAGIVLDDGTTVHADAVVLAAGSWSSLLGSVPSAIPRIEPVRGQLVLLDEGRPRLSSILFAEGAYAVPRGDGHVVCGSTTEHVGHRREVTVGGVLRILTSAAALAPGLSDAELVRAWCNFRPRVVGKAGALVGPSTVPGLFVATGHYRNGILLAKSTAEAVADAILAH